MQQNFIELRLDYARPTPFSETPVIINRFADFLNAVACCRIYDTDISAYTAEWFETNAFVAFLLHAGSGSISHELASIEMDEQIMKININTIIPSIGTCDMASWIALVPVAKSDLENIAVIDVKTISQYK